MPALQVASFAATMLATIPVLLGNEFDVNVGLKRRRREVLERLVRAGAGAAGATPPVSQISTKYQ